MPTSLTAGHWAAGAALFLAILLAAQVAVALAAGPDTFGLPQVIAQIPTPTPFRFLTPTPFVPSTSPAATPMPRAGGLPIELALPALAGGLAALGGGSLLLRRRRPTR